MTRFGPAPRPPEPARFEPARFDSARPFRVRFGPHRFDPFRFGPHRFGPFPFGRFAPSSRSRVPAAAGAGRGRDRRRAPGERPVSAAHADRYRRSAAHRARASGRQAPGRNPTSAAEPASARSVSLRPTRVLSIRPGVAIVDPPPRPGPTVRLPTAARCRSGRRGVLSRRARGRSGDFRPPGSPGAADAPGIPDRLRCRTERGPEGRGRGGPAPPPFRRRAGSARSSGPALRRTARRRPLLVRLGRGGTADRCGRVLPIRTHGALAEPPASRDRSGAFRPRPGSAPGGATRLPGAPEVGAVSSDLMGLRTPAPRPESATGPDAGRGGGRRERVRGGSASPPFRRRAGCAGAWGSSLRETARRCPPLVGLSRRRTADRFSRVFPIPTHGAVADPRRPATDAAPSDRSPVPLRQARRPFPPTARPVS